MTTTMVLFPYDAAYAGGGGAAATASKANQACYSCRKQKRKCDKAVPSCGLCTRMGRNCDYSEAQPTPTAEDLAALQLKLAELESRLNYAGGSSDVGPHHLGTPSAPASQPCHTPQMLPAEPFWQSGASRFPAAVFLDSHMFQWTGLRIPEPTAEVPNNIFQCIGNADDLDQTLSDFFGDIHPWFPMVSRKHMNTTFQLLETGGDMAILVLAMKLITSQPQRGFASSENYLYTACKRYAALLESMGTTSLEYAQALTLIALYEYGQGIYPAAWMTVAQCVRYADYLGLQSYRASNAVLGHPLTWADTEERRRVWWAIYILDKLVSLGSFRRSLCPDPSPDDLLPSDDKAWNNGNSGGAFQRPVSTSFSEPQPEFARLCQAALVVSKGLQHHALLEQCKTTGERFDFSTVASLSDIAHTLCQALLEEITAFPAMFYSLVAARAVCFSVSLKLLGLYVSAEPMRGVGSDWDDEEIALRMTAIEGVRKISLTIRDCAADLYAFTSLDEDVVKVSPVLLPALYLAAVSHQNAWKETGDPDSKSSFEITKKCLLRLSGRWRLGKELLDMLELQDMNYMGSSFHSSTRLAGIPLVIPGMS